MTNIEQIKRQMPYSSEDEKAYINCQLSNERARGFNEAIDYLHSKGLLMVWQPIETAPQKEGEVFICRDSTKPHVQFEAAWFYESEERDGAHVFVPGYYLLQNLTIDIPIDDYSDLEWMPLPKLPEVK